MERIAIIGGTGDQGFGLALRWARAGYPIIIGSRDHGRAQAAAQQVTSILGPEVCVEGMMNAEAVKATSLIVLTVPFAAQLGILKSIKESFKPGDVLIDVTVPLEAAVGGRATRLLGVWAGSAAEQAAQAVPQGVDVVSAFHHVAAQTLQALDRPIECDVIVCGNSAAAKERVRPLVEVIKECRYVDGGRLENSRIVEAITALLVGMNIRYKTHHAGIRVTGL
ncbi:MAG: NADPH-dependent F420 reductase [Acidobacteriota bacterium]|nr:NADPH-dependent F420 reductase [Blastocatellia bacterium]MDW8241242.1 NADPH-dependent F420 reductase [Acidobacteriota bacterium]